MLGPVLVVKLVIPLASWCGLTDCVQEKGKGEVNLTLVLRDQSRGTLNRGGGGRVSDVRGWVVGG